MRLLLEAKRRSQVETLRDDAIGWASEEGLQSEHPANCHTQTLLSKTLEWLR